MKYTLLDLVQTILSRMDSDEVNSINDTVEAQQVATVIRSVYFDILARSNLPENYTLVTLDGYNDPTKPVLMTLPSNVSRIEWIKYNKLDATNLTNNMQPVYYLPLLEFLNMMHSQDIDATEVLSFNHTVGSDIYNIMYRDDKNPDYYTTFDDSTVLFDSYDSAYDTSLQKSKTLCYGKTVIPFTMSDTFTPALDEEQFPLLLNEALSVCWLELKQSAHPIAERNSRRHWTHTQKNKESIAGVSDFDKLPNFGKVGRMGYSRYWPGKYRAR